MITFDSGIETTIIIYQIEARIKLQNMIWSLLGKNFATQIESFTARMVNLIFLPTIFILLNCGLIQYRYKGDTAANRGFFIYIFNQSLSYKNNKRREK